MVTLTIDGKEIRTSEDRTILEAALDNGIYIPHLCSHENLHPEGSCRLCVVKQEGVDGVITSCTEKCRDGMVINSRDELAEKVRKLSVDLMFRTHPSECTGCPKYGKCQLQSISQFVGDTGRALRALPLRIAADNSNPVILHEMYRCILCGRCVRACNEMRGVGAIKFKKVDGRMRVVIDGDSLKNADCRFCSACVEVCPTGSIREHEEIASKLIGKTREAGLVPCAEGCPAHINVPKYLRYIREGNYDAALAVVREKAPFPKVLGYICTHKCETECRRNYLNEPVAIRDLKRFAAEHAGDAWKEHSVQHAKTGRSAAIIGSGPAGLTAAWYLEKLGHDVTVFEKKHEAGGMLRYGIPAYRLPRDTVDGEIKELTDIGVTIKTDSPVENAADLLGKGFDAVFAAVGTHEGVKLPVKGNDLEGVFVNTDFLARSESGEKIELGKNVVVLGGGNVALDCAGMAKRLGAENVHLACLESYEKMTASEEELRWAQEEGVKIHNSRTFLEITGQNGKAAGMKIAGIKSFSFDSTGKAILDLIPDSEEIIPADSIIFAVGQRPGITADFGLETGRGNRIAIKEGSSGTSVKGVFAAGDAVTGTASVIQAIANARAAAAEMDRYLGGDGMIEEKLAPDQDADMYIGKIPGFADEHRVEKSVVPAAERVKNFELMDRGCDEKCAVCEAGRCLQCDLRLRIAPQKFWSDYNRTGGEVKNSE